MGREPRGSYSQRDQRVNAKLKHVYSIADWTRTQEVDLQAIRLTPESLTYDYALRSSRVSTDEIRARDTKLQPIQPIRHNNMCIPNLVHS